MNYYLINHIRNEYPSKLSERYDFRVINKEYTGFHALSTLSVLLTTYRGYITKQQYNFVTDCCSANIKVYCTYQTYSGVKLLKVNKFVVCDTSSPNKFYARPNKSILFEILESMYKFEGNSRITLPELEYVFEEQVDKLDERATKLFSKLEAVFDEFLAKYHYYVTMYKNTKKILKYLGEHSSAVEHLVANEKVEGSNPSVHSLSSDASTSVVRNLIDLPEADRTALRGLGRQQSFITQGP